MIKLSDYIDIKLINLSLQATDKLEVIDEMIDLLMTSNAITDREKFKQAVLKRENTISTGIGYGLAIPHGRVDCAEKLVIGIGRSSEGIEFESLDDEPAFVVFMFAVPQKIGAIYQEILAAIPRFWLVKENREQLLKVTSPIEVLNLICESEQR